jgi:hypothetical protein
MVPLRRDRRRGECGGLEFFREKWSRFCGIDAAVNAAVLSFLGRNGPAFAG